MSSRWGCYLGSSEVVRLPGISALCDAPTLMTCTTCSPSVRLSSIGLGSEALTRWLHPRSVNLDPADRFKDIVQRTLGRFHARIAPLGTPTPDRHQTLVAARWIAFPARVVDAWPCAHPRSLTALSSRAAMRILQNVLARPLGPLPRGSRNRPYQVRVRSCLHSRRTRTTETAEQRLAGSQSGDAPGSAAHFGAGPPESMHPRPCSGPASSPDGPHSVTT